MQENRASSFLQTSSQALVIAAGLVYLFGFIIVSVFDASYGIADFSLFRTKVIAVGTLFAVLFAVPMFVTFRMFGFFGFSVKHAEYFAPTVSAKNVPWHMVDVALFIPFACNVAALPLSFLFASNSGWKPAGFGLWLLLTAIISVYGNWSRKGFDRHPVVCVLFSFFAAVALFVSLFIYSDRSYFWMVAWMSLSGVFTLEIFSAIHKADEVRKTPWERLLLTILPLAFGVYAFKVYPNIKHEFGGGAPVPVILHLTKKVPVFESESGPALLIDETEQGYYVVHGTGKAIFVTRGLVEEVEFLRTESKP